MTGAIAAKTPQRPQSSSNQTHQIANIWDVDSSYSTSRGPKTPTMAAGSKLANELWQMWDCDKLYNKKARQAHKMRLAPFLLITTIADNEESW